MKADQKARNRYLGGSVPFGWQQQDDGSLVEVPAQQAAIRRMIELRSTGLSLRAIAQEMQATGHALTHEGVRGVLSKAAPDLKRAG